MLETEPISIVRSVEQPRHTHQEVVDLLAAGLLRLRTRGDFASATTTRDQVDLGFGDHQRVNANPDHENGVRP
jgi:hypothetical protein